MNNLERYLGQVLDEKYRLERLLGQGGMGAVFLATHLGTDRYVALKLIAPQFMQNQEFVERFKREARAAGRLRHPNVVDVTDFGIAKLGEVSTALPLPRHLESITTEETPTLIPSPAGDSATVASTGAKTQVASPELEAATLIQSSEELNGFATPLADNDQATRM